MREERLTLAGSPPGQHYTLTVCRFGAARPGAGKAYVQAALHADEVPALLVAQRLRERLARLDADGSIPGEVVLVPYANPLGLAQRVLGQAAGRFDLADGINFNRLIPDLSAAAVEAVRTRQGDDPAAAAVRVRAALREAAAALPAATTVEDLKRRLLALAADADVVLDLHCDNQAVVHVYALTPQAEEAAALGAWLGAQAVLLATESGDAPFDEACSRPWWLAQQAFPALPLGCFSVTVELRGEADTDPGVAERDADALLAYLRGRGIVDGDPGPRPQPRCVPTPLSASEPIAAPHAGVLVFHAEPGQRLAAGATVATLVDLDGGAPTPLVTRGGGVLYARIAQRWAGAGQRVAKVAGTSIVRTGKLLGA